MSNYLESIKSLDSVGTSIQEQAMPDSTPILEMSGETPTTTCIDIPTPIDAIGQDAISYSAPQKVIVRTYRLRK